ncbi:putative signal peptidase complex component [Xylona heveae TC161]|uniref:Signal peptidase complex subunit 2 n=1 Tax=Xylona heveae (strain CBS 132557 / TC161) TaxID=1328760 RepID=A0A161TDA6_XYLHT|nr:putative signal peptidase complex component [Xylona heveae TC161]KZF23807.1 putative signal peptidase complex component [Xylona heveae TC161]
MASGAGSKIAVYSLSDLKNTTDDALPNYLNSLKFKQSHYLSDVRLALGYSAVAIAGGTFYFDYTLGFEKTKGYTLWAVILYFILNSVFTYWIWAVERGTVYVGEWRGTQVKLQSHVKKHTPVYDLAVQYKPPKASSKAGSEWKRVETSAPFNTWFSADGAFVAKRFQQWLATEIPVIGQADPASAGKASNESSSVDVQLNALRATELAGLDAAAHGDKSKKSNKKGRSPR